MFSMSVVLTKQICKFLCVGSFMAVPSFQIEDGVLLLRTSTMIACLIEINVVLMRAHLGMFQRAKNSNSFIANDYAKYAKVMPRAQ